MSKNVSPKVTSAAAMTAVSSVLLWALAEYADFNPPAEIQIAIVVILTFLAGYIKTDPLRGGNAQ